MGALHGVPALDLVEGVIVMILECLDCGLQSALGLDVLHVLAHEQALMLTHDVVEVTWEVEVFNMNGFESFLMDFFRAAAADTGHHHPMADAFTIDSSTGENVDQAWALEIDGHRKPAFLIYGEMADLIGSGLVGEAFFNTTGVPERMFV